MTIAETYITSEQAAALLAEIQALKEQVERNQQSQAQVFDGMGPALLAQQRRGVEAQLDAPPQSFPEGYTHGDPRPLGVRRRDTALAHVRARAEQSGGRFDPKFGSAYGHRDDADYRCPQLDTIDRSRFADACQRHCWTVEREQRELQAAGLRDFVTGPVIPLSQRGRDDITRSEVMGTTLQPDGAAVLAALAQALGLRPQVNGETGVAPTVEDVKGRYLSQGENPTAETAVLTRSTRRRTV